MKQPQTWQRPTTKEDLMASRYKITVCAPYDNPGTIRTGREWFDRYMLHPWERGADFELLREVDK